MQDRKLTKKPIYRDLLTQNISEEKLTVFLQSLFTSIDAHQPVKDTDEINEPVFCNSIYYHTALAYATRGENIEIIKALLNIGAHPNIYLDSVTCGSALLLAMQKLPLNDEIFSLFLTMTDINIFVTTPNKTAFDCAQGNTATISRLLNADQQISIACLSTEIDNMADTIAKSWRTRQTNFVVCQQLAKIYRPDKEIEELSRLVTEECKMKPSGTPASLSLIIQSYLFLPKPVPVKNFQSRYENVARSNPISVAGNEPKKRDCNIM